MNQLFRKGILFILLLNVNHLFPCDCVFQSFVNQANHADLTIKGKVLDTRIIRGLYSTYVEEVTFQIKQKYIGRKVKDVIRIRKHDWRQTCDRLDVTSFHIGEEYFINLYLSGEFWKVATCGRSWVKVQGDSLISYQFNSVDSLDQQLRNKLSFNESLNSVSKEIYDSESYRISDTDTFSLVRTDKKDRVIFKGDSVNGHLIGEHWEYHINETNHFITDEKGIQGEFTSYDKKYNSGYAIPYKNNKREGEASWYLLTYKKKLFGGNKGRTENKIIIHIVSYKKDVLHGELKQFSGNKLIRHDLYENGEYIKCLNDCVEF